MVAPKPSFASLKPPPTKVDNTHADYSTFIVVIVTGILASLAVLARIGHKIVTKTFGLDDYAIIPALAIYIGWTAMASYMTFYSGFGKPLGEVTYGEFTTFYKGSFIAIWIYPPLSASIRVSILFFYHRLFSRADVIYQRIIYGLLALQGMYVITFMIVPIFICTPVRDAWEPIQRKKHCNTSLYIEPTFALYIISLIFDLILLVFPLSIVWSLQMSVKKKASVLCIFLIMTCAPVAACYKLVIFREKARVPVSTTDPTWFQYQASTYIFPQYKYYGTGFWIPTHIEPTVAMLGTSVPTLLTIYSAASLQFSKIRSAIASSLRGSASSKGSSHTDSRSQRSWRNGLPDASGIKHNDMSDSHVELRPVNSNPSMRSHPYDVGGLV